MPESLESPTGISRWLARAPIWLYRCHLGWVLGKRFLLLNHVGHKTGLTRSVVVQVVRHDPISRAYIICSGWGERSQWYQHLMADPNTTIQVGFRVTAVHAHGLSPAEGAVEMVTYSRRRRRAARRIAEFAGCQTDGSEESYREIGERLPFVRLDPRRASSS